jgi:hypothetical protein
MLHCALPALPEPLERLAAASRPAVAKGLRIWLDDCARSRASRPLAWSYLYGNVWTYKASTAALRIIMHRASRAKTFPSPRWLSASAAPSSWSLRLRH